HHGFLNETNAQVVVKLGALELDSMASPLSETATTTEEYLKCVLWSSKKVHFIINFDIGVAMDCASVHRERSSRYWI
ncbi:hypothetical protein HDU99_003133, partial [Rhizoclosmatium hyalinum]